MKAIKIWMLAQIINAMFSIMFLGPLGFIVMAFAVLGGIPAIPAYAVWLWVAKAGLRGRALVLSSLLVMPVITALCAMLTTAEIDHNSSELNIFCILPVIATAISIGMLKEEFYEQTAQKRKNDKIV